MLKCHLRSGPGGPFGAAPPSSSLLRPSDPTPKAAPCPRPHGEVSRGGDIAGSWGCRGPASTLHPGRAMGDASLSPPRGQHRPPGFAASPRRGVRDVVEPGAGRRAAAIGTLSPAAANHRTRTALPTEQKGVRAPSPPTPRAEPHGPGRSWGSSPRAPLRKPRREAPQPQGRQGPSCRAAGRRGSCQGGAQERIWAARHEMAALVKPPAKF